MKITNSYLQTYQSMNAANRIGNNNIQAPAENISRNNKLEGSSFSDILNSKEIDYLNRNFELKAESAQKTGKTAGAVQGKRIDILV